jgi:hypothetical protein
VCETQNPNGDDGTNESNNPWMIVPFPTPDGPQTTSGSKLMVEPDDEVDGDASEESEENFIDRMLLLLILLLDVVVVQTDA